MSGIDRGTPAFQNEEPLPEEQASQLPQDGLGGPQTFPEPGLEQGDAIRGAQVPFTALERGGVTQSLSISDNRTLTKILQKVNVGPGFGTTNQYIEISKNSGRGTTTVTQQVTYDIQMGPPNTFAGLTQTQMSHYSGSGMYNGAVLRPPPRLFAEFPPFQPCPPCQPPPSAAQQFYSLYNPYRSNL